MSTLESELGLWPWDVLHQGIANRTPLSFGLANVCVGVAMLVLGGRIGIGTVANGVLAGLFIQALESWRAVSALSEHGLGLRIALLVEDGFWLLARSPLAVQEPGAPAVVIGE